MRLTSVMFLMNTMLIQPCEHCISRGYASLRTMAMSAKTLKFVKSLAELVIIILPRFVILMEAAACFCHSTVIIDSKKPITREALGLR